MSIMFNDLGVIHRPPNSVAAQRKKGKSKGMYWPRGSAAAAGFPYGRIKKNPEIHLSFQPML